MRDFVDESGMVDSMDALAVCARAGKRQRMSMEKMDTAVEQMRTRLASVREEVLALQGQMDVEGEKGRQERLRELVKSVSKTVAEQQKEIIEAQKVLFKNWYSEAKNVDAKTVPNIEKRCFPTRRLGTDNIMQAVTKHFYRQGKFQIAEKLVEESKTEIQDAENTSMPFTTMTTIVEALKSHDVEPAISWAKTRRTELRKHGSSLEFALHRLVFLGFVQKGDWQGAISYAKAKFGDFSETQMGDIQSLMGCLLYINRLDKSPYASLFLPSQWTDTIRNFKRDYCKILGVPRNSPLCTTVTAVSRFAFLPLLQSWHGRGVERTSTCRRPRSPTGILRRRGLGRPGCLPAQVHSTEKLRNLCLSCSFSPTTRPPKRFLACSRRRRFSPQRRTGAAPATYPSRSTSAANVSSTPSLHVP
mmetsp:Transcript_12720/g.39025  ORF Transcript_12720/g.39025 Transcript_12720/m.39025 type:complete len:416 (+) Transcript_12720:295-1542(+)